MHSPVKVPPRVDYDQIRPNTTKYDQIWPNTAKYGKIWPNKTKYGKIPNTTKSTIYDQIQQIRPHPHTTKYDHIRPNTTVVFCRIMSEPSLYYVVSVVFCRIHSGGGGTSVRVNIPKGINYLSLLKNRIVGDPLTPHLGKSWSFLRSTHHIYLRLLYLVRAPIEYFGACRSPYGWCFSGE